MRLFCGFVVALLLLVRPLSTAAQAPADAAAYHKAVARVQFELVKKDLRYSSKTSRTEDQAKTEQRRRDLVARSEAAVVTLRAMPDYPGNAELRTRALRLVQALKVVQTTDYKRVNELSQYRDNSLEALRVYCAAHSDALHKTLVLNDSLTAARISFADQFGLELDEQGQRVIAQWLDAERRVAALFQYHYRVMLPCVRVRLAAGKLVETIGAADAVAFEKARRYLATEAATSTAELAAVPDFIDVDVLYRNAGRELVATYAELCANQLAQASAQLQSQGPRTAEQAQRINQYLAEFSGKVNAANQVFDKAGTTFFKMYTPVLDEANQR